MNDDVIDFSELEIVPKNECFYYQIGISSTRIVKADEETFKNMLVATAVSYNKKRLKHGDDDAKTIRALRTYKFYENQIDMTKGDMFTALLYPFFKWVAIK